MRNKVLRGLFLAFLVQIVSSSRQQLEIAPWTVPFRLGALSARQRWLGKTSKDTIPKRYSVDEGATAVAKNTLLAVGVTQNSAEQQTEDVILCGAAGSGTSSSDSSGTSSSKKEDAQALEPSRPLIFWESMICGAVSRSVAQTIMHPANTMKTILQSSKKNALEAVGGGSNTVVSFTSLAHPKNFKLLTRGAGAQFVMSVPHGAANFAVLEFVRARLNTVFQKQLEGGGTAFAAGLDFMSSAISTICCSIISTPQMMITDNIMAGTYSDLPTAVTSLYRDRGIVDGFYAGWWPGLAGKIPSYAMTWTFFQQLKTAHTKILKRPAKDVENTLMGCFASTATVCIMIPMDTIKTRLVTQVSRAGIVPYNGIIDCAKRVAKEEGIGAFYRGLPPRLLSVVPMIGIQFGVYEFMRRTMLNRGTGKGVMSRPVDAEDEFEVTLEEVAMEVAADDEQPFPAPQFRSGIEQDTRSKLLKWKNKRKKSSKN